MTPDPNWKAKKSPAVWRRANRKYAASVKGKAHIKAKSSVRTAVRNGSLKKPTSCPSCGRSGVRIIAHHTSGYAKSSHMKIRWMCPLCHERKDKARSPENKSRQVKAALAKKKS